MKANEAATAEARTSGSLEGKRILVAEDSLLVAMILTDALSENGCCPVGPVTRIQQALAAVDENALDGAVLDVNLNGDEVYPIAEALQQRGIPFIFATGYDAPTALPERFSGSPVIRKPFRISELEDLLKKTFG